MNVKRPFPGNPALCSYSPIGRRESIFYTGADRYLGGADTLRLNQADEQIAIESKCRKNVWLFGANNSLSVLSWFYCTGSCMNVRLGPVLILFNSGD